MKHTDTLINQILLITMYECYTIYCDNNTNVLNIRSKKC